MFKKSLDMFKGYSPKTSTPTKTVEPNYPIINSGHDSDLEHAFQLIGELAPTLCLKLPPDISKTKTKRININSCTVQASNYMNTALLKKGSKTWKT
jgi:hypothetical protein